MKDLKFQIKSIKDVEAFFIHLIQEENLNFHPDEDFENYINFQSKLPSYSREEAKCRNKLLKTCFEICEKEDFDIYQLGINTLFETLKIPQS